MSDQDDRGIYISLSKYLKGDTYVFLVKQINAEILHWLESEEGKNTIKNEVNKCIRDAISHRFSPYNSDPRIKTFEKMISERVTDELLKIANAGKEDSK